MVSQMGPLSSANLFHPFLLGNSAKGLFTSLPSFPTGLFLERVAVSALAGGSIGRKTRTAIVSQALLSSLRALRHMWTSRAFGGS